MFRMDNSNLFCCLKTGSSMEEKTINVKDCYWQAIINPNALSGKCTKLWQDIVLKLKESQISYKEHIAGHANAGKTIAKALCLKGERHFIIVGGDGTVNEVINGIATSGINLSDTFIVPFPMGTGNDWTHTHQYPKNCHELLVPFLKGTFRPHDIGLVKSIKEAEIVDCRYFINIAGFCFDAAVIDETTKGKTPIFTTATYIWNLIKVLFTYKSTRVSIKAVNINVDAPIFTIAVGIGKYNGNGMMQVPMGNPFDGLFDVVIIKKINPLKVIANIKNLFSGKHIRLKEVSVYQTHELEINATPHVLGEVEGEMLTIGNYKISMLPEWMNVLTIENEI